MFVPDSSYQLTDTVKNDVYTFTVTVTNAAGSSREISERVVGKLSISDENLYDIPILHVHALL